nr:hypothetical protein [Tanacetum cinerariifolium]
MAKTINREAQLHAKVDGKKIIFTESSVRRDLRLADEEGIDCLPNSTIFEQIALMGDSGNITKTQSKATPNEPSSQRTDSGGGPRCQETMGDTIAQIKFERVSKQFNNSLLARGNTLQSDEDSLKLDELMALCTTLQNKVLDLEKTTTTQCNKIASLKKRVKKLEKKNRSRTHRLKRLYKVCLTARVESYGNEESFGEDASKQGRRINVIDADENITLISAADNEMFDVDVLVGEEMFVAGAFRRVNTFEDFKIELVKGKEKRLGKELVQEITKKQKVEDDKEKAELKQLMEIIPNEEEVAINAIPLAVKSLRIVDWKIHKEGNKSYYQIVRVDGKSQIYMIFS